MAAIAESESPLLLFMFFAPRYLWVEIAEESTRYQRQQIPARADALFESQRKRRLRDPSCNVETRAEITMRLKKEKVIEPQELTTVVALLIARVISPQRCRLADHWVMSADGAIPAGTFGRYMSRNRFTAILRDLHFVDNTTPPPAPPRRRDKCWKLRRVITVLQKQFFAGWRVGARISFDESIIPCHHRMNTTRSFNPDKPHKWGTKLFVACDTGSAYCFRWDNFLFFCQFFSTV